MNKLIQKIFSAFILENPSQYTEILLQMRGLNRFFHAETDRLCSRLGKKHIITRNYETIESICVINRITENLPTDITRYLLSVYIKTTAVQPYIDNTDIVYANKIICALKSLYNKHDDIYAWIKTCSVCGNNNVVKDDSDNDGYRECLYPFYCLFWCNIKCRCGFVRHITVDDYVMGIDYYSNTEIHHFGYYFDCEYCGEKNERNMDRINNSDTIRLSYNP